MGAADVVVVGAGVAGLYVSLELARSGLEVVVIEEATRVGGRIDTHADPLYERGASHFREEDELVSRLIASCAGQLTRVKCGTKLAHYDTRIGYVHDSVDRFRASIDCVLRASARLTPRELRRITFRQLCDRVLPTRAGALSVDEMACVHGSRCVFDYMNAFDACETFASDCKRPGYEIKEGLRGLCDAMAREVCSRARMHLGERVAHVYRRGQRLVVQTTVRELLCETVVLAVPPSRMARLPLLSPLRRRLRTVRSAKLLRVVARFPVHADGPWFASMSRTTTNSFLRQIIPLSNARGLICLSCTEGEDVGPFLEKGRLRSLQAIESMVMPECRRLFGDVPDPTYFNAHLWAEGAHYWRTHVDSDLVRRTMVNPLGGVLTCGEGFSAKQGSIEGALASAELVVRALARQDPSDQARASSLRTSWRRQGGRR